MAKASETKVHDRFGRLRVRRIYRKAVASGSARPNRTFIFAECECDCGKVRQVRVERLGKITNSCGCLRLDAVTTHGVSKSHKRLYCAWYSMVDRCTNKDHPAYHNYGGRGIAVCRKWITDPAAFRDWALAHGYRRGLTLDRCDNDKGYSPENCRWATMREQINNTRANAPVTFRGETLTVPQWAERTGIDARTIRSRLGRGWSAERALTTPVYERGRRAWKTR